MNELVEKDIKKTLTDFAEEMFAVAESVVKLNYNYADRDEAMEAEIKEKVSEYQGPIAKDVLKDFGIEVCETIVEFEGDDEAAEQSIRGIIKDYVGFALKDDICDDEGWPTNKQFDQWTKDYVPNSGKADTVFGEILRAVNQVAYRYYNDGDLFNEGYGAETVGSSALYLMNDNPLRSTFTSILQTATRYGERSYEPAMKKMIDFVSNLSEAEIGDLLNKPNTTDSKNAHHQKAMEMWGDKDETYYGDEGY
jgi:hypothetical protein